MHIEEQLTHQGESQLSLHRAQAIAKEQLHTPDFVEVYQFSHPGLQMAIATSGLGLWEWNLVSDQTYYDPHWKQILGYEAEEIENHRQSFERLVHPEDLPKVKAVLNDYLKGLTSVYEVELRMLTKSGEWKWILDRGQVFQWDESGKPIWMAGSYQDITKQKRQEETLYAQYRKAVEHLESIKEELKYAQQQLFQNEKMVNLGQMLTDLANEIYNPVNFINTSLQPATEYAEEFIRLIELYQHYYSPPEEHITTQLECLDLNFMKTDFLKLLWSMQAGSERIRDIVFALWNFSRFEDGQKRKADLHEGLDCVLGLLQSRLKEQPNRPRIHILKEYGELPLVECDAGEINHVFMNILTNAIDALEERMEQDVSFIPKICIQTEVVKCHLSLVGSHDKQSLKHHKVIVRIYDNGKGILPHIKKHILEPFFTTKIGGKNRGLGLSISQEIIVGRHQGKLKCNSRLGQGTEFAIELSTKTTHYGDIVKHSSF
ncbi:MAG: PAS domain-containing protein [Scytonema sp. PMC 1069.18]|nr:PAS domain-containing protein [Scytonema sp. PMC 1069.18]MEC4882841.1 PAS domain-containing protein [Scytonema sp. PMC 1070.18]